HHLPNQDTPSPLPPHPPSDHRTSCRPPATKEAAARPRTASTHKHIVDHRRVQRLLPIACHHQPPPSPPCRLRRHHHLADSAAITTLSTPMPITASPIICLLADLLRRHRLP
ncbi:hypothetical protein Dimus_003755, partial [Dionaea muscipula]